MSSSHYEENNKHRKSVYTTLDKTRQYTCPDKNKNYTDFHGGTNCLCIVKPVRSSLDMYYIAKEENKNPVLPVTTHTNGWK